jgi:hypothetical protein
VVTHGINRFTEPFFEHLHLLAAHLPEIMFGLCFLVGSAVEVKSESVSKIKDVSDLAGPLNAEGVVKRGSGQEKESGTNTHLGFDFGHFKGGGRFKVDVVPEKNKGFFSLQKVFSFREAVEGVPGIQE